MTKTLADMTPDERSQCVGMWCDHRSFFGTELVVVAKVADGVGVFFNPEMRERIVATHDRLELFTPRFDLPRVWTTDGEPVDSAQNLDLPEAWSTQPAMDIWAPRPSSTWVLAEKDRHPRGGGSTACVLGGFSDVAVSELLGGYAGSFEKVWTADEARSVALALLAAADRVDETEGATE